MLSWIVFAVLLSFIGTPRTWRRNWRTSKDDPFWKPRTGLPSVVFKVWFVSLSRREAIPAAISGPLLAFAYKFQGSFGLWCAIAWFAIVIPIGLAIWLFNQPSILIPPPLRAERGALQVWIERHRASGDAE